MFVKRRELLGKRRLPYLVMVSEALTYPTKSDRERQCNRSPVLVTWRPLKMPSPEYNLGNSSITESATSFGLNRSSPKCPDGLFRSDRGATGRQPVLPFDQIMPFASESRWGRIVASCESQRHQREVYGCVCYFCLAGCSVLRSQLPKPR